MKIRYRITALILALITVLPLVSVPTFAEDGAVLYSENFDRFSQYSAGKKLTREDGFPGTLPNTVAVGRESENTYVRMDFKASGDPSETVYYLDNASLDRVDADTKGAIRTDAASYGLISGNDGNIDKNLQIPTPELSHMTHGKVVLEIDYYLSEDANGSIYSQFLHYSSAETDGKRTAFFNLYNIDPETGALNLPDGSCGNSTRLSHGEWNTVSVVLDLASGVADYYLNRCLYAKAVFLGKTDIVLFADSWIIAKIHRTRTVGQIAAEELGGYFGMDNVRIATFDEDSLVRIPSVNEKGEKLSAIALYKNGKRCGNYYRG